MAQPKYVSKSDYEDFSGINLDIELNASSFDRSDYVDIFLTRIENYCLNFLKKNYHVFPEDDAFDSQSFSQGVLYQIDWVLAHGDTTVRVNKDIPQLAPNAYNEWKLAGMCNIRHDRPEELVEWV
jgi:hypothetical protein